MNTSKVLGMVTTHYGVDFTKYPTEKIAKHVINQYKSRMADNTQMLRWVNYAKEVQSEIPAAVEKFDNFAKNKKVIFASLGGSKNPLTAATDAMGLDLHDNKKMVVAFLKPNDLNDIVSQMGKVEDAVIVLNSKSGKTPEILAMAKALRDHCVNHYVSKGKSSLEAAELANKQIMVVSDKDPKKSILRAFAQANNLYDAKEATFQVPDGMGGRYSHLCKYVAACIRAAGGTMEQITRFYKGAEKASEKALSKDFKENVPLQNALFWTDAELKQQKNLFNLGQRLQKGRLKPETFAKMNLAQNEINLYSGNMFERYKIFKKQLNEESIKNKPNQFGVIPDVAHYEAEAWYHPENNNVFSLITCDDIEGGLKGVSERYISESVVPDLKRFGPLAHTHIEDINSKGYLTPEATSTLMTNDAFETYDRGMLRDLLNGKYHKKGPQSTVLQPAVEGVKVSNEKMITDYKTRVANPAKLLD